MAFSGTPTGYSNLCTGRLADKIAVDLATGITVTADTFKTPSGTGPATWPTGNQIWKITRKTRTNVEVEYIGVESLSQTGTALTTGAVIRYLSPTDGTSFTSQGDGLSFAAGSVVELVWSVQHAEQTAFKNNANTWSAAQTIANTIKWLFGGAGNYIMGDGNDLKFKDGNNSEKTLSQLAAAGGSDEKAAVSSNDTTPDYLVNKFTGGDGITITETDDAGDETLDIDIDLATNPGLEFSSGELQVKVRANAGLSLDANGVGLPAPSTNGNTLQSNGTDWVSGAPKYYEKVVYIATADSTSVGSSNTDQHTFDTHSYTIPANDLVTGVAYTVEAGGLCNWGAGTVNFQVSVGGTEQVGNLTVTPTASGNGYVINTQIVGSAAAGAAATVRGISKLALGSGANAKSATNANTPTLATNGTLSITIKVQFGTSNGTNSANLGYFIVTKRSTTPFA